MGQPSECYERITCCHNDGARRRALGLPGVWLSMVGARALSIGASTCIAPILLSRLYSVKLSLDFISIEQRNNHNSPQHNPQAAVTMVFAWKAAGLT